MFRLARARQDHDVSVCAWRVSGALDLDRCAAAVQALARRQPAMRSALRADGGGAVVVVGEEVAFPVAVTRRGSVRFVEHLAEAAVRQPVPLDEAPWGSLVIAELGAGEHAFVWRMGHAGWDAVSATVLEREFRRLYADPDGCAPPVRLETWAAARRRLVPSEAAARYWSAALAGWSPPRSAAGYLGAEIAGPDVDAAGLEDLTAWARDAGATLPAALLALLGAALGDDRDRTVAPARRVRTVAPARRVRTVAPARRVRTVAPARRVRTVAPAHHRHRTVALFDANRAAPEVAGAIGCIVDLLLVAVPRGTDLRALLGAARDAVLGAYDHRLPVEHQLRFAPGWDPGRAAEAPFADVALNVHARGAVPRPGAPRVVPVHCRPARRVVADGAWWGADLVLNALPAPRGGLAIRWTFNAHAHRGDEISRIGARFAALTRLATRDFSRRA
jgi:condensation domain-containing protein